MRAIITGRYLDTVSGNNKKGEPYSFVKLLVGDKVVNVFNFDGTGLGEFEEITLDVDISSDARGLRIRKVGEGG